MNKDYRVPSVDWKAERQKYPAILNHHYFRTAAVGPLSPAAIKAYQDHQKQLFEHGELNWMQLVEALATARATVCEFFDGERPEDFSFGANTSMNFNLLAMGCKQKLDLNNGHILTTKDEFPSTVIGWRQQGFQTKAVDTDQIIEHINEKTLAVAISACQYATGYRTDLVQLGEELNRRNIPFIVNATQANGAFPISVKRAKITALSASCHKWLCAGFGVSILYINPEFLRGPNWPVAGWLSAADPMQMNAEQFQSRNDCSALETGVGPIGVILAVAAAMRDQMRIGQENIAQRICELSSELAKRLGNLPRVEVISRRDEFNWQESVNTGTILLKLDRGEEMHDKLGERNIYTSYRPSGLRISTHFYNDNEDLDALADGLKELTNR